jgi:hypothetical protein
MSINAALMNHTVPKTWRIRADLPPESWLLEHPRKFAGLQVLARREINARA